MIRNTSSIVQHLLQIKNGIVINDNVIVNSITRSKTIALGVIAYVFVRVVDI